MARISFQVTFLVYQHGSLSELVTKATNLRAISPYPSSDEQGYLGQGFESLEPGTIVIYNENVKLPVDRDDCPSFGMPMTKMARGSTRNSHA